MTDGCVHLLFNNCWNIPSAHSWAAPVGQRVEYGKGRWYGPFITYKITPAGSLSSRHAARRVAVLSHHSSLRPHGSHPQNIVHYIFNTAAYSCDISTKHTLRIVLYPPPSPMHFELIKWKSFLFPFYYIWIIKVGTIVRDVVYVPLLGEYGTEFYLRL